MNTLLIDSYLYEMGRSHPRHRERFSEQTWLTQEHEDGILQDIRLRYSKRREKFLIIAFFAAVADNLFFAESGVAYAIFF